MSVSGKRAREHISVTVGLSVQDLIAALRQMDSEEREDFVEDLLAGTSPEYLDSIAEARQDWSEGRVKSHEELFRTTS
jgi:hypothetical protein